MLRGTSSWQPLLQFRAQAGLQSLLYLQECSQQSKKVTSLTEVKQPLLRASVGGHAFTYDSLSTLA